MKHTEALQRHLLSGDLPGGVCRRGALTEAPSPAGRLSAPPTLFSSTLREHCKAVDILHLEKACLFVSKRNIYFFSCCNVFTLCLFPSSASPQHDIQRRNGCLIAAARRWPAWVKGSYGRMYSNCTLPHKDASRPLQSFSVIWCNCLSCGVTSHLCFLLPTCEPNGRTWDVTARHYFPLLFSISFMIYIIYFSALLTVKEGNLRVGVSI